MIVSKKISLSFCNEMENAQLIKDAESMMYKNLNIQISSFSSLAFVPKLDCKVFDASIGDLAGTLKASAVRKLLTQSSIFIFYSRLSDKNKYYAINFQSI